MFILVDDYYTNPEQVDIKMWDVHTPNSICNLNLNGQPSQNRPEMYQNISQYVYLNWRIKSIVVLPCSSNYTQNYCKGIIRKGELYFYFSNILFTLFPKNNIMIPIAPRFPYGGSNCPDTYQQDKFLKSGHGPVFLHRLPQKGNLLPKSLQERIPGKLSNDLPLNCELP